MKRPVRIYADPIDGDVRRLPWYRWIPNNYRTWRQAGTSHLQAASTAVGDWWKTKEKDTVKIIWMFIAGLVAAVALGFGAMAAADDSPTGCVAVGDGLGTVTCSEAND